MPHKQELIAKIIRQATAKGADYIHLRMAHTASKKVTYRLGAKEAVEDATKEELGLRVFKNKRVALVSTTKLADWQECLATALDICRLLPQDEAAVPPAAEHLGSYGGELLMAGASEPSLTDMEAQAEALEQAALATKGITNSEGAAVGWTRQHIVVATSASEPVGYERTTNDAVVSVLAGEGHKMVRDYEWQRQTSNLATEELEQMGKQASEAAVARLAPTKPASKPMAVVFAPRTAAALLGQLETLLDGKNAALGNTLWGKKQLGSKVASPAITLVNEPTLKGGVQSYPVDMEGVAARRVELIKGGVLQSHLLDNCSATALGQKPLGHAVGEPSVEPHPKGANLHIQGGKLSPEALMADIKQGFYVTELLGLAFNRMSGDLSRGAAGFIIRDGKLAEPVAEVTIAANISQMLGQMTPANDLAHRFGTDSPTLRVEQMMLAGR